MIRRAALVVAAALALAATAAPAVSQDWENWLLGGTLLPGGRDSDSPWRGNLALGYGVAPAFPGSVSAESKLLPLIDIEWRDRIFLSTQRGIGINWLRGFKTRAGPRIMIDPGRSPGDHRRLAGTRSVKRTVEAGLFIVSYTGAWRFNADVRLGVSGGHDGVRANLGASYGRRIAERTSLILGGHLRLDGASYNADVYGNKQSAVSEASLRVDVVREFGAANYLTVSASGGALGGPAKHAAYTGTGTFFGGILVGHRF